MRRCVGQGLFGEATPWPSADATRAVNTPAKTPGRPLSTVYTRDQGAPFRSAWRGWQAGRVVPVKRGRDREHAGGARRSRPPRSTEGSPPSEHRRRPERRPRSSGAAHTDRHIGTLARGGRGRSGRWGSCSHQQRRRSSPRRARRSLTCASIREPRAKTLTSTFPPISSVAWKGPRFTPEQASLTALPALRAFVRSRLVTRARDARVRRPVATL
jgi:hypothetical protein